MAQTKLHSRSFVYDPASFLDKCNVCLGLEKLSLVIYVNKLPHNEIVSYHLISQFDNSELFQRSRGHGGYPHWVCA